ncbi:hypothetical protein HDV04_001979 [Boothiomyces sp. JEL0838]|nr:hypothetical protein HDV04_001979 [Boothiomyces sp. JEL0838]
MSTGIVFQSGWLSSFDCSGPPTSMIIFNETNPTAVFSNLQLDFPIPICGSAIHPIPIGCCISSVDLIFTYNYQSITRQYIPDSSNYNAPAGANQKSYCTLTANDSQSLNGYIKAFYLENGQCIDGFIVCNTNNTVSVYNQSGCTGYSETFNVNNQVQLSHILGSVMIGSQIVQGSVGFVWEAVSPHAESVPLFHIAIERLSAFCYGLALLTPAATSGFYAYRYYKVRKQNDLFFSIAQFMLLANIVAQVTYTMTAFTSDISMYLFDIVNQLTNVYSLLTVYISLYILFTIYGQYQTTLLEKGVYATMTVLHLATMYWNLLADIYGLFASQDKINVPVHRDSIQSVYKHESEKSAIAKEPDLSDGSVAGYSDTHGVYF